MYHSQRQVFLGYLKNVLPPNAVEAFLLGSLLGKTALYLGEKQGTLVNNECSSWYSTVGNF